MLTPSVAQEIARETSSIIGINVLITDRNGIVIGSGDTERVGSFHEASIEVVRTLRATSHDAAAAHRLKGVQPGVTLPVLLDNEAVGTVGLTGDPEQVERFGRLVRNQTEVLLRESLLLRSRLLRERATEELLRDVTHYDAQVTEPDFIAFKSAELGYDLRLHRVVVVLDLDAPETAQPIDRAEPTTLQAAVLRTVRRAFAGAQDIVGTVASGRIAVLHAAGKDRDEDARLVERCAALADHLARAHTVQCRAGIGGVVASVAGLHESYRDAASALYLGGRLGRSGAVTHIADVRAHDLLAGVPHPARARFAQAVLGPLPAQSDWPVIRATLTAWCEAGFSLVRAAAALRVHRNTLVYRLDKIETLVGPGLREPRTCLALYLACLLDALESPPATSGSVRVNRTRSKP
jgi:carbohydrate diacid regulator